MKSIYSFIFNKKFIFIVQLIYNVVLVSAAQPSESALYTYILSLLYLLPTPLKSVYFFFCFHSSLCLAQTQILPWAVRIMSLFQSG